MRPPLLKETTELTCEYDRCAPMRVPDVDGAGGVVSTKADVAAGKRKPDQADIYECVS